MDISSDKQTKFHTRRLGDDKERETLREKQTFLKAARLKDKLR